MVAPNCLDDDYDYEFYIIGDDEDYSLPNETLTKNANKKVAQVRQKRVEAEQKARMEKYAKAEKVKKTAEYQMYRQLHEKFKGL